MQIHLEPLKRLYHATGDFYGSARRAIAARKQYLSPRVALSIVTLALLFIGVQVWGSVRLSQRAIINSESAANYTIAKSFADRLRIFGERAPKEKVYLKIENLAELNPAVRIYLLDEHGIVKASPRAYGRLLLPFVDLRPIKRFLASTSSPSVVFGDDPHVLKRVEPISVATLRIGGGPHLLYVVLAPPPGAPGGTESALLSVGAYTIILATISISVIGLLLFIIAAIKLNSLSAAVAALSHDMRSPLSAVQGYLETLLERGESLDSKASKRFMSVALRSAKSATSMLNDLHHLSKLEAEGGEIEREQFSLPDLIMDIVMGSQAEADEKKIRVTAELPSYLPLAYGNIQLIERLLRNVIGNGIRYTPPGGRVRIETLHNGGKIRVMVSDSGVGIPADEIEKVRQPFYRGNATKETTKGSGIGLLVASKVARLHGGDLKILSRVGEGTVVVFEVPVALGQRSQVSKS